MISRSITSFKALLIREYWEHKGAIFYTPLFIAGFFALVILIASLSGESLLIEMGQDGNLSKKLPQAVEMFDNLAPEKQSMSVQIGLHAPIIIFGFVMLIVSFFYALGSLYDERKDRSILFWKSLPISDISSVFSKFVTVCISIPVFYFAVIACFQLFILLVGTVVSWLGGSIGGSLWLSSNLFVVMFNTLLSLITASLWLAPIWAWLMFASSWAKKSAFLWGLLPVLLLAFAEAWLFHSNRLLAVVGSRIAEGFSILTSELSGLADEELRHSSFDNWLEVFADGEFWVGLIVSLIFLMGAALVRRFSDDT